MKTIKLLGTFNPINTKQLNKIIKLHNEDEDRFFIYECDDKFKDCNALIEKKYPYIQRCNKAYDEVLDISEEDIDFSFGNFDKYPEILKDYLFEDVDLLKELVSKMMSLKRYEHSLSVAEYAKKLSKHWHLDENKAYLAGLLHDVTKSFSEKENDIILKKYDKKHLNAPKKVKHSYTAKYFLKELGFKNEEILDAIYNHTICLKDDNLCKIIYIADKREPLRHIEDNITELAYCDLDLAFETLKKRVEDYLKGEV